MKIISWNVNSVRARILNILDYISLENPDILLFQEIKKTPLILIRDIPSCDIFIVLQKESASFEEALKFV